MQFCSYTYYLQKIDYFIKKFIAIMIMKYLNDNIIVNQYFYK